MKKNVQEIGRWSDLDVNERKHWNENHKLLTNIILNPTEHQNAVELFLTQHRLLHRSSISNSQTKTLQDALLENLQEATFRQYPVTIPGTKNSIAWHLWHITRIEDMTMNVLVAKKDQVLFLGNWYEQLGVDVTHSGNDMTEKEVADLSRNINFSALLNYRDEVGKKTHKVVTALQPGEFRQKVDPESIHELVMQGAVTKQSAWLLEYWGKKTIAGLILMPATRHIFLHLNKSMRIKHKIQKTCKQLK